MLPEALPLAFRAAIQGRRLEILRLVWSNELSVGDIAQEIPISLPAVSQHLAKLKAAKLVSVRKDGRKRYYQAVRENLGPFEDALASLWGTEPASSQPATPSPPPHTGYTPTRGRDPGPETGPGSAVAGAAPADDEMDEMASWYRQGLRARIVALEQARAALPDRPREAADSIRRIAKSLTRPVISQRFGDIRATALDIGQDSGPALGENVDRLIGAIRQASGRDEARIVKILIVEDNRVESMLYRSVISGPNREVLVAQTVEEAHKLLDANDIGLILLDLTLPGADGRDLLLDIGQRPRTAAIPVIMLTGRTDVQTQTEALSLGAAAYYRKPVESSLLAAAASMILERAAESRELGRLDPLTGLRNRRIFLEDVKRLAATAVRAKVDLSLAIMDIDRLSAINDVHGNEVGDAVIRSISTDLVGTFRISDLIARWDGDQFAVLFSNARADGAALAMEKLRTLTEARVISGQGGALVTPWWRAGIASIRDAGGVDDAVARATRRLYAAQRGANRIVSMDVASPDRKRTVLLIEDDEILADLIEHRLDRGGFAVKRFSDGAEALAGLASVDAAAVVLDTMLPGAQGYEVLRRLKESPSLAGIPVIVLTFGGEHEATRAFKLGASDSLAKPFSVEELVARVTRLANASEEFAP